MDRQRKGWDFVIDVMNGMGRGLFASLIVGLILRQAGAYLSVPLLTKLGSTAQILMGPAIAASIACSVSAPPLAVFSSLAVGAVGAGAFAGPAPVPGEPVGAAVSALVGVLCGKIVQGKGGKGLDILLIPLATIVGGGLAAVTCAPWIARGMNAVGDLVNLTTTLQPLPMGIAVSVVMGMILTLPISSAALAISLGLSGLAAGASTVGCSAQMVGFAVMSFRENGIGGLIAQGLGTSMIQVPNIMRNPWIWVPPTLASAVLGPLATLLFRMKNNSVGAGMGTSGLVGQIGTFAVMGESAWPGVILLHFVLPALLTWFFARILEGRGLVRPGDMTLDREA